MGKRILEVENNEKLLTRDDNRFIFNVGEINGPLREYTHPAPSPPSDPTPDSSSPRVPNLAVPEREDPNLPSGDESGTHEPAGRFLSRAKSRAGFEKLALLKKLKLESRFERLSVVRMDRCFG